MKPIATQKHFIKTALRLPPEVHGALHAAAATADRSYNAEIINRLRSSLKLVAKAISKGNL